MKDKLNVAVIGAGLIGQRRADCAYRHPQTALKFIVDIDQQRAQSLSEKYHCGRETDWKKIIHNPDIDIVVVSTPNHFLCSIACAALESGKNVLMEKPMARNLKEAKKIYQTVQKTKRKLKVGFNHRYHPAIQRAYHLFQQGAIGKAVNLRAVYGHGGRPGYEKEWRGNYKLAGGGELTDQGVHLIDLIQWFFGQPAEVFAMLQTAFWKIQPSEDNAFVLMRYANGLVASFHASWTQWKNQFSFEIFGTKGSLSVNGLGGSYGPETLTLAIRRKEGGIPKQMLMQFPSSKRDGRKVDNACPDSSWQSEWDDFIDGIVEHKKFLGDASEGLSVMQILDAIYCSAKTGKPTFPFYKGVSRQFPFARGAAGEV